MPFVIDASVEIDAPADTVWEVLTDLPRYPDWNPFCLECDSTLRPGDPITMRVDLGGKPIRQREWMLEYTEGQGFSYRMKPLPLGALSSMRSHEVIAIDGRRTRYRSHFHLSGWLRPIVTILLGAKLKAGFAAMTAAVATRAEQLR